MTSVPVGASAINAFLAILSLRLWLPEAFVDICPIVRKVQIVKAWSRGVLVTSAGLGWVQRRRLFVREWVNGYLDGNVRNGGSLVRKTRWVAVVATSFVVNCVISEPGIRRSLDERCHQTTAHES
jgi:hypothetical protein